MNKYYVTFGVGNRLSEFIQPIVASSKEEAEKKMNEVYGREWAFCYDEDEFNSLEFNLKELRPIYCGDPGMTFGEMRKWTERFNQILGGAQCLKDKRLASLMTDMEQAYGIPFLNDEEYNRKNPFVIQMYRAASEARAL